MARFNFARIWERITVVIDPEIRMAQVAHTSVRNERHWWWPRRPNAYTTRIFERWIEEQPWKTFPVSFNSTAEEKLHNLHTIYMSATYQLPFDAVQHQLLCLYIS